jgi:NTE family protein
LPKDIALALGGGGVRGFAHLGVIHVLQKSGFQIQAIAGTSAGAIIGSLFAAGYNSQEIQYELESIESSKIFRRKAGDLPAIFGLQGLEEKLRILLGNKKFDDLSIAFVAVAVDSRSAQIITLREGSVVDAVMASCALPGFFPPKEINGRIFFDGGVSLPVPVTPSKQLAPGLPVVAVALSPSLAEWAEKEEGNSLLGALPILQHFVERSRLAQSINSFLTAVDIGNVIITELTLEKDPPDILIRPRVYHVGLLDQAQAEPLITAGEDAAFDCLEELNWVVSWQGKLARMFSIKLEKMGH